MTALFNEIDANAAQWIRNLVAEGHVAPGRVDARSIKEITAADLDGVVQFHTFAGIAIWSHALRVAGWPDSEEVWTGSCRCQPFSNAGSGKGFADERHLWPDWFQLIEQRRPAVVFGEQVASKDGLAWLDVVQSDLEAAGYAFAAFDLCAAGFGAPHIRQRIYFAAIRADWLAHHHQQGFSQQRSERLPSDCDSSRGHDADRCGEPRGVADHGSERRVEVGTHAERSGSGSGEESARPTPAPGPTNGHWADVEWLACRDGKARPTQPGLFPLVDGSPERVGLDGTVETQARSTKLKAYGNGIVAEQAIEFIKAVMLFLGMETT